MLSPRFTALILFSATLLPVVGLAQSQAGASRDQVTVRFSQSADNEIEAGGIPAGEIGVNAASVVWRSSLELKPGTRFSYGLDWKHYDFSRPVASAVPDTLQEIAVVLGASQWLGRQWLLSGTVSPGLYGDLEGDEGDAFNAPVLLLATYLQSETLAWAFGLRVDGLADRPVIPFVGVNWKFAPHWEFSLGVPRAGFTYTVSPALKLNAGASVQGGNFHVARDPRPASIAIGSRLDDTTVDYHEIRVGLAADYRLNEVLSLTAEAGLITDQKLDYFDRDYRVDGDRAAYFTVGLTGRF